MPNDTHRPNVVYFPVADVRYSRDHLIAASGLLHAIHALYSTEGVLSVGAVVHVAAIIDGVIEKMKLADRELDEKLLPF